MSLVSYTAKTIGKKYELGGAHQTLDCFSLILDYLKDRGYKIPDDFMHEGYKFSEYPKSYKKDPAKLMNVAFDYIASLTEEIPKHKAMAGDILFVSIADNKSMVISGGNGNIVAATTDRGITILEQDKYEIKRVFRCLPSLQ